MKKSKVLPPAPLKAAHMVVLVVDDDPMVRKIIVDQLRTIGFEKFLEAGNGTEAHKFVLDTLQRIDLIICDWEMPKTDGLTLLRAVRSHRSHKDTPFIMVTSQQSQERMKISKAKQHEVDAYIVKPFRAEVLRSKVSEIIMRLQERRAAGE